MKKITLAIMLCLLSWCGYSQLALEGFEAAWTGSPAAPPGGWVVHNEIGAKTWVRSTAGSPAQVPFEGSHAAYLDSENVLPTAPIPSNWLITPQFNVPVNGLLHFYSKLTKLGDQGGIYKIMIASVTDPTVPAAELPFTDLVPALTEFELNPTQLEFAEKTFAIPAAYTGTQVRIALIMQGDDKDRWLIDNLEVISLCNAPSALSANNVTLTTAELNWANPSGVTQWEIEVVDELVSPTGTGVVYSGTLPYLKTGLSANGDYKYYVRSLCADGGESLWVGPFFFKTPTIGERCSDPLVIPAALPFSTTNNTVNFGDYYEGIPGTGCNASGNYLAGNDVVYSYTPTTNGIIHLTLSNTDGAAGMFVYNNCANIGASCIAGVLSSAATPGTIPTLAVTAGTTYYIVISTNNAPLLTTNYMLSVQQVQCAAPASLAVGGQTSNSVNLSWAAGAASSWEIAVQTAGAGLPIGNGQTVTQNTNVAVTQTLAGVAFTPATNYEYYVRANCGDGTFSIWAGPFAFATTQVPASLPLNENFDGPQPHGFSIVNGTQANKWYVGSVEYLSPSNSLYISNNFGVHNYYTTNSMSTTHVYKDITIPAGTTTLGVSFDLKAGGDANDYVRMWLVPVGTIPAVGTQLTAANSGGTQIGGNYNLSPTWSTQNGTLNVAALAGQTRRVVFEWRNDAIGGLQTAPAIDNILIKAISCPQPTGVTADNVTNNQAVFSWTVPTGTTPGSYDYYYSDTTPPTAGTAATGTVNGTSVTISPLNTSSIYSFWVRSNCGSEKSFWTGPFTFSTAQAPAIPEYTENFDQGSHGFALSNGNQPNKWVVGTAANNSAPNALYVSGDNGATNTYLTSQSIIHAYRDFQIPAGASQVSVSFDYKGRGDTTADYMKVWLVPITFIPVPGTAITAGAGRTDLSGVVSGITAWTNINYDIPTTGMEGQMRKVIFEWRNDNFTVTQPAAAIDNFNIKVTTCPKPTGLTAINFTPTNVTLDWTEAGTSASWEVAVLPAGSETPASGTTVTGDTSYTPAEGTIQPEVFYAFYVRSVCGGTNGFSNWAGPYQFALKPANDDCATATNIPVNTGEECIQEVSGTVVGAMPSGVANTCGAAGSADDDVWFSFVATNTTHVVTVQDGSAQGLTTTFYSGSCGALVQRYCTYVYTSTFVDNLVIGQTYYIRVYTATIVPGQKTTFKLCVTTPPPPPVNDECANATVVPINPTLDCVDSAQGTVYSATASPQAKICAGGADDDVWFTFIPTSTKHQISLTNVVGSSATWMYQTIYKGSDCNSLTEVFCTSTLSNFVDNLVPGDTYKIRVYSGTTTPGQTTAFRVCIGTPLPVPANDECAGAVTVPVNPTLECTQMASGTIQSSTASPQPNACNPNDDDDVWFKFTATSTVHAIELKNITGSTTDLFHVVYTGNCGAITMLYCSDPNYSLAQNLVAGQEYYIRVYSNTANPNQTSSFDICINTMPSLAPANDDCANAIAVGVNTGLTCDVFASGMVYGATASTEPNNCATNQDDDDIWYEFVATSTKHIISFRNITGSTAGLSHALYAGSQCGSLVQLYCSSTVTTLAQNLVVGDTYKVRVYTTVATPDQTTAFDICIRIPNTPIDVNTTTYNVEELVRNILVNSPCALVSNISSKSGAHYDDFESIGYFESNGAIFPFPYGVVLSTGSADAAKGQFVPFTNSVTSSFAWMGDDDLEEILEDTNEISNINTFNATVLEFDFVPLINTFSFDFLFASTEFGAYQCGYSDVFAFILTDEQGNTSNLAVLPNTDIPVSVTTIKDGQYNNACPSENIEYFGQQNEADPYASAINFNGQTKMLTATSPVNPGETYHIKLVIADNRDGSFASAVFLGGGTFDLGEVSLGDDLLVENGTAVCDLESTIIDTHMSADDYVFTWYKDGAVIPGATDPSYEVTESGSYGVEATLQNITCTYEGTVTVEFYTPVNEMTGDPATQTICDASGFATFDLTSNLDAIISLPTDPQNFTSTIHFTQEDAESGDNEITTTAAFTNTIANQQTLWIRTVYSVTGCVGIKSFDLVVEDRTPQYTINSDFSICAETSGTIDVVLTDTDPEPVIYTWTKDGDPLADTTPSVTVTEAGAYTVVLDRNGCTATATVNVTITPIPVADAPDNVTVCGSYQLPVLTSGNYYTGQGGTGEMLEAGDVIETSQLIYVYASSGTTPSCWDENSFTVDVTPIPAFELTGNFTACVASNVAISVNNPQFDTNTATYAWTFDGNPITGGTTVTASDFGIYELTVTVNNCTYTQSVTVSQNTDPVSLIIVDGCEDGSYMVSVEDDNGSFNIDNATYLWEGPDGFTSTERKFAAPSKGEYFVTVTTAEGCIGEDFVVIAETSCNIQRGISPNGDGLNDTFDLSTLDVKKLSIYNRYGHEVYSKTNYTNEWNGTTSKGDELPTGTYFYMIERNNGESSTGWIYINRQQ